MSMKTKFPKRLALSIAVPALVAAAIAPACVARAQQGAAERAGQTLDQAGRGLKRGIQNAFAKTRNAVHEQEVIARVYSRLHWDKTLVGSTLEMEVRDGGTILLRGVVPDEAIKRRAVILARDTVGVTAVVDELAVPPPPRPVPAVTPAEPETSPAPLPKP